MLGSAGVMPTYEYEHIPAIDFLGGSCASELSQKQVSSIASQLGKKQVLTETFGCSGYDITPKELLSIGEYQYFNGVTLMCHHLFPFSLAGQGKYDYPTIFSKQNNWWKQFRSFNEHFTKLGYLISNTKEEYDVGIIHPVRSVYLEYICGKENAKLKELQEALDELLTKFRKAGVRYQFIDETILAKYGRNENNQLVVGECAYQKIVVPKVFSLAKTTVDLLKDYKGKLCLLSEVPCIDGEREKVCLYSNTSLEEIIKEREIKFTVLDGNSMLTSRKSELGEFLFIKNLSKTQESYVTLENGGANYQSFDLENYQLKNISDQIKIEPNESCMLVRSNKAIETEKHYEVEDITADFSITGITKNFFVLDRASYSKDGVEFSEIKNIQEIFECVLREDYKGRIYIKHSFCLNDKLSLKLLCEKNRYVFIRLNGREISLQNSDFDIYFKEVDITNELFLGENELVYCIDYYQHDGVSFALFDPAATESLRNCLYYDTHLENSYLMGDFVVDSNMQLCKVERMPTLTSKLYEKGYPFFKGQVLIEGSYFYDCKGERILSLKDGRFLTAGVYVNGVEVKPTFETDIDITYLLKRGKNDIKIQIFSSLRNLFGPHHSLAGSDWDGLTGLFTFRGEWQAGTPKLFTPEYQCAPFGIERILLKKSNG